MFPVSPHCSMGAGTHKVGHSAVPHLSVGQDTKPGENLVSLAPRLQSKALSPPYLPAAAPGRGPPPSSRRPRTPRAAPPLPSPRATPPSLLPATPIGQTRHTPARRLEGVMSKGAWPMWLRNFRVIPRGLGTASGVGALREARGVGVGHRGPLPFWGRAGEGIYKAFMFWNLFL